MRGQPFRTEKFGLVLVPGVIQHRHDGLAGTFFLRPAQRPAQVDSRGEAKEQAFLAQKLVNDT